jgi:hypothetical protein
MIAAGINAKALPLYTRDPSVTITSPAAEARL